MKSSLRKTLYSIVGACCISGAAHATSLQITYENLSGTGGLWNTRVFIGLHDGSFDTFDLGSPASSSIESLAEEGMPGGLLGEIGAVVGANSGVIFGDDAPGVGPGVLFNPGSSASITLSATASSNRYLTFASMLLPSNDAFIGNDSGTAYDLLDANGNFSSMFTINIFGSNVWDAGTENNDTMGDPFSMVGGMSTSTMGGVVSQHGGLGNFIGTNLVNGNPLTSAFDSTTPIGRITVKNVPDTASFIGVMSIALLLGFRRFIRNK